MSHETNESSAREQGANEPSAAELESFFANRDEFERLAEPLQPGNAVTPQTQPDDVTLPPTASASGD